MGAEYYPTDERGSQTMVNPATGAELWTSDPGPHHIHGVGIASDLDPDYDGVELWGRDKEPNSSSPFNYFNAQGGPIEYERLLFNKSYDYHAVYWDADPQRELITAGAIFDRKSEVAITSVEWDIGNGETTISYPFNRGKTVWASDWNTSPGSNRVDFREGFESPGDPDYIEIVPVSGSDEWTMTWKGDPIFVTPQSTYFVTVNFKGIRDGVDFRMEILGNGVNIMPNAPSISVDGTGSGVTYLAVFTAPAGVTEIKPVLKGDGPSNYRYQINSIRIMEDNTPNRIRLTLAGTDRFWGDILGDWREEIITSYGNELRVYSTRVPAADRRVTYLQDPIYRADVAALAMGYAQVPTASTLPGFETASVGEEVILDNTDTDSGVSFQGTWTFSTQQSGRYGANYQHDGNTDKGNKSVTYTPTLSVAGHYEVFISTPTYSGWEDNVPVEITHADGVEQTTQDLTLSANYNQWVSFGSYNFTAGTAGNVLISNAGTNNHVIIDAVKFVYVGGYQEPPDGGETVSLGAVNYGVAAQDNATGTGYILWSATNVHTRFNPQQYNSDHMIAVKWTGSEWVYDTNEGYVSFTPQASDVLIAEVDFSNDTISSLEGVSGTYQGIELGYASGDLSFAANVWNGGSNAGEFTVSGTAFTKNGDGAGGDFFVFQSSDLSGYGGQDGINNQPTSASVSPDGSSLTISGNAWKKVPYNYTLTPNSVLEFTVYSSNVDEILAIGVDTNNVFNDTATTYMLAGSQTDLAWTLLNGGVYTEGDTVSFQIPIGQDLSGTISYLTFIADDDDQGAANGTFTDVRIRELPNTSIPIDATQLTDYHNQTTTGSTTVSADQLSLTLTGNTWRKMPYTYTVTADTILEVTIDASNTGEITGIGVDTDSDLTTGPKLLRLSGSTPHSRFNDITPLYIANSGAYVYEIPLGNYYTGPMNYLVFVADDDDNPSANVQFSNVRLYESP
ncbi:MAG: hypothetical protein PF795_09195 [Kiritimatiellae bacterium]|jgi:hypothetical protein|nr:hypothetical protein [Kiritimatiellia bacterium]